MHKLLTATISLLLLTSLVFSQVVGGAAKVGGQTVIRRPTVGGGASDFVTDTFTDATNVTLAFHTGEVGAAWTKHPDASYSAAFLHINTGTGRIWQDQVTAYYASGTPPSADYSVCGDVFVASVLTANIGVCGRMSTSANDMYCFRQRNGVDWQLLKIISGTGTTLGTPSTNQIPGVGTFKRACLVMSGSSISGTVDGVTEVGPVTDTTISAAGVVGIRAVGVETETTGFHLDNFSAR
jgi:hypothetical protein